MSFDEPIQKGGVFNIDKCYNKIVNPDTGRKVNLRGPTGLRVLEKYDEIKNSGVELEKKVHMQLLISSSF